MFKKFWGLVLCAGLLQPVWAESPLTTTSFVDLEGKALTLDRLEGRVTVVVMANQENADAAKDIGQDIVFVYGPNKNFAFISVVDLRSVPSFAHGIATNIISDKVKTARQELRDRVQKAGRTYVPADSFYVPDWDGQDSLALLRNSPRPEYASFRKDLTRLARFDQERLTREQQKLRNHVHVFILDGKGEVKAHFVDQGSGALALNTLRTLLP